MAVDHGVLLLFWPALRRLFVCFLSIVRLAGLPSGERSTSKRENDGELEHRHLHPFFHATKVAIKSERCKESANFFRVLLKKLSLTD